MMLMVEIDRHNCDIQKIEHYTLYFFALCPYPLFSSVKEDVANSEHNTY